MSDSEILRSLSVEEMAREVRARVARLKGLAVPADTTPDKRLQDIDLATLVEKLRSEQKVIYGVDDRQDVFQITDQAILNDADSVVILCDQGEVVDNGNGTSTLQTQNFGTSRNLCATEPFRDQPTTGFCSGFLVAPDIIATAGHCVDASNVTTRRFVFGFRMLNATTARVVIDNTEIYRGVNIIGRQLVGNGADWALVRIDRPVTNHRVVAVRRAGQIANNQAVHVIGHPVGLPTKVAGGAAVRDNSPSAFFVANLDTYGGNSGSPVFNRDTHEVEGILVRGETDFTTNGTCVVSFRCPDTGCRGEDCTRTTEFAQLIPVEPAGTGEFYTTDGSGNISLLRNYTDWRQSWYDIIPGNYGGSSRTDLLFYEQDTGTGEFYTTDGSGNISLLRNYTDWRQSWYDIIPGNFSGSSRTDLLFYETGS